MGPQDEGKQPMKRVPFDIASLEVAIALEIPPPPSAAEILRSSTSLAPMDPHFEAHALRLVTIRFFADWKARQAGRHDEALSG
jgi:hypothetical protein